MKSPQSPHLSSLWVFALSLSSPISPLPSAPISHLGTTLLLYSFSIVDLRVISGRSSASIFLLSTPIFLLATLDLRQEWLRSLLAPSFLSISRHPSCFQTWKREGTTLRHLYPTPRERNTLATYFSPFTFLIWLFFMLHSISFILPLLFWLITHLFLQLILTTLQDSQFSLPLISLWTLCSLHSLLDLPYSQWTYCYFHT